MKEKFESVINSSRPVLVDFYADWCAPCRDLEPILKRVKAELQENVRIIKVNVDRNPELASLYRIRSIPSLMLFKNGQVIWSGAGVLPYNELVSIIEKAAFPFQVRSQAS